MPIYTFRTSDDQTVTRRLSFSAYEAIRAGTETLSDAEGKPLTLVFDPGSPSFTLKDGVSGGWASKAGKENNYRRARSLEMARREKDHVFKSKLVPNYNGSEASSWKDVQDHVRSTKGNVAASTYNSLVSKEAGK